MMSHHMIMMNVNTPYHTYGNMFFFSQLFLIFRVRNRGGSRPRHVNLECPFRIFQVDRKLASAAVFWKTSNRIYALQVQVNHGNNKFSLDQPMVNWWFGSRWFGIGIGVPLSNKPLSEIPNMQSTNPNHQLTLSWYWMLQKKQWKVPNFVKNRDESHKIPSTNSTSTNL